MLPLSEGGFEHLHERVIDIEMSYEKITVGNADSVCKLWSLTTGILIKGHLILLCCNEKTNF